MSGSTPSSKVAVARRVELTALLDLPIVSEGDDVGALIAASLERTGISLETGDVLVVTSKLLSRAEGRFVDLSTVNVSAAAAALAEEVEKDPALVELILRQSESVSRKGPGVLIVRHRLGFVSANAAIDASNARPTDAPTGSGPWALLMPSAPDDGAEAIRASLARSSGASIGVVISDSLGRPFRLGTVGAAVGVAGLPPLSDERGADDLFGRPLEYTTTAIADQLAAAADMVAGQADQARPVVHIRGLSFTPGRHSARELQRPPEMDLYA